MWKRKKEKKGGRNTTKNLNPKLKLPKGRAHLFKYKRSLYIYTIPTQFTRQDKDEGETNRVWVTCKTVIIVTCNVMYVCIVQSMYIIGDLPEGLPWPNVRTIRLGVSGIAIRYITWMDEPGPTNVCI